MQLVIADAKAVPISLSAERYPVRGRRADVYQGLKRSLGWLRPIYNCHLRQVASAAVITT
jgi:hypothetical protein